MCIVYVGKINEFYFWSDSDRADTFKENGMRLISDFLIFYIILFFIGPLHNCESPFDFAIEFAVIFIIDNRIDSLLSMPRIIEEDSFLKIIQQATPPIHNMGSHRLSEATIRGVNNSPYLGNGEQPLKNSVGDFHIVDMGSRRLSVSTIKHRILIIFSIYFLSCNRISFGNLI